MNKVVKRERILVDRTKISKIMTKAKCGQAAVYNALSFRTNSELAAQIRELALSQFGGVLVKEPKVIR